MLPRGLVNRKHHGQHNRDVCDKLIAIKGCNDWVITTAFYASLHLLEHEIFPLPEGQKVYADFSSYWASVRRDQRRLRMSKHQLKINLAHQYTKVGGIYESLHDKCMDARYKDYRVDGPAAKAARKDLKDIEAAMKRA